VKLLYTCHKHRYLYNEMFADDTLLFNSGNPSDVSSPIQDSLSQISDWCNEWLLRINPVKCESMRITRSKTPSLCSYNINSTSLNQVHTHKHLGVILSSDLSWKMHVVLTVAAKANKILGLLKCTFGKCSEAIITRNLQILLVFYQHPAWFISL